MSEPVPTPRNNGHTALSPMNPTDIVQHLSPAELMLERGTSGLKRAGGYIREDPLVELSGLEGVRTYSDMRNNSSTIGACLYATEHLVRNVQWKFTPADSSDDAIRYADLARGMLFEDLSMPWSLLLSEILSFLPYGWSMFEMVFKRRLGDDPPPLPNGMPGLPSLFTDGLIGLGKLAPRSQDTLLRWELDDSGTLLGMHQLDPYGSPGGRHVYLPYEKCLHFRPTSYKDNPEGRSILRTAYRDWYMVKHIQNTEGIGIERDLTGIPLIYGPPQWWNASAQPEDLAQLEMIKRIGKNVRQDEQVCLILPAIFDQAGNQLLKFELVSSPGTKQMNTDTIIQRYELRMTQSMLCDMIFLGHEDVGSFALASSKSTTQAMSLGGYLKVIKDEFNRRCIPVLWKLNALPPDMMPCLDHGDVETVDLTELSRFILSFGRVYNMNDLENHVRQLAGFPERPGAETHPLPPAIQPHQGAESHGGGSGTDVQELNISPAGSAGGLPDLDRDLSSQSLGF